MGEGTTTPEPQLLRGCMKAQADCQKSMRAEMATGVKSFHEALGAHREELREERQRDRKEQNTALMVIRDDIRETLGKLEKSAADAAKESADTRVKLKAVDSRSTSNKYRLNWLYGILAVVIGGLLLIALGGGIAAYYGWVKKPPPAEASEGR